jgi:hypothetical protein
MKLSQAEFLLRLAENTDAAGDDVSTEMHRLGVAHAHRLLEDLELLNRAMEINRAGRDRFAQYMPRQSSQGQSAIGRNLAEQRAALIHGGKDETQTKEQRPTTGQRS